MYWNLKEEALESTREDDDDDEDDVHVTHTSDIHAVIIDI